MDAHFKTLIKAITNGSLIPFLGAGVNLCDREGDIRWTPKGGLLPSGGELSVHLADNFGYPSEKDDKYDLVRVSQFVAVMAGTGPLYDELRLLLDGDFPPTSLHTFLAELPKTLRELTEAPRYQLIVTTNYDDVLERAFRAAGEEFHLVSYEAKRENRGKFWHHKPGGESALIDTPNSYRDLPLDDRGNLSSTVILKIHGAIDRRNPDGDSYVITEDDYIDYLTRTDIATLIPSKLLAKLRRSAFLFMGYGLRDWNLRVILYRIWGEQQLEYHSWAIQRGPNSVDTKFWSSRNVEILDKPLKEYVAELRQRLQPSTPGGQG